MIKTDQKPISVFCVFHHIPFERGKEGDEDGSHILEQLIYKYPDSYPDRTMEHLLSVLISLYTFTSLSNKKNLDFLSWSNSKVAIRTYKKPDNSLLFFVLRVPSNYSDLAISKEIDLIKQGIFFALGPEKVSNNETLKEYLKRNGERLTFASYLPSSSSPLSSIRVDPILFSFPSMPHAKWHRPNLASVLIEVTIMQTYSEIWGIVCFSNGCLLASHMPIYMIKFFDFISAYSSQSQFSNQKIVYLTKDDRINLLSYPGAISKIPDQDVIETSLITFQHEFVTFYLLADPKISSDVYEKVHETLSREMIDIASDSLQYIQSPNAQEADLSLSSNIANSSLSSSTADFTSDAIVYNSILNILDAGQSSEEFQKMAIEAHDLFAKRDELRDIVLNNAKEFIVCMNILNVEYYAAVNGRSKLSLTEMYNKAIKSMPGLQEYLRNLHLLKE